MKTLFLLLFFPLTAISQKLDKPNIVYIFTDQQSANAMSCTDNPAINTPAMDNLANDGILYTNAYCTFPVCSPSRASMLAGRMPHQTGNDRNGVGLPDSIKPKTLGFLLQKNGYETMYAGKWHLPDYTISNDQGFKKLANFGDRYLADSCIAYIKKTHEKPFFLMISYDNPHNICEYARNQPMPWGEIEVPIDVREHPNMPHNFAIPAFEPDIIRNYQAARPRVFPVFSYTPDDWRRYRYVYNRLVEKADFEINRIIKALKDNGLYDNSLIIFSSDHGDGQGAHQWNQKSILYEESIKVPLIVKLPENKHAGSQIAMPVSAGLDLLPTICEIAGINEPEGLEGENLLNWVVDKEKMRGPVFVETVLDIPDIVVRQQYYGYAVIKENLKYVHYSQGKYREQLFNLEKDSGEMVNLAIESQYDETLKEFREILVNWLKNKKAPGLRRYVYH